MLQHHVIVNSRVAEIAPTEDWSRLAVAIRTYFDPEYAKRCRK